MAIFYGIVSYVIFLASFVYAIGFVGNFVVPKSIDSGLEGNLASSLIIDLRLLGLFAVQHSVMARPWFKRWWTRIVPQVIERSTYVLLSSLLLAFLFWRWRPLHATIWEIRQPVIAVLLQVVFFAGWATVVMSTAVINHSDLFGLRQVFLQDKYTHLGFRTPSLYKLVRHPIMLGFIIAFWATPRMTLGHLLFAVTTTIYILIAIQLEERDLSHHFGALYEDYRRRVSMLIPLPKKR